MCVFLILFFFYPMSWHLLPEKSPKITDITDTRCYRLVFSFTCSNLHPPPCHPAVPGPRTCSYLWGSTLSSWRPEEKVPGFFFFFFCCRSERVFAKSPAGRAHWVLDVRCEPERGELLWWTCGPCCMTSWGRCTGQVRLSPGRRERSADHSGSLYGLMSGGLNKGNDQKQNISMDLIK